MLTDFSKWSKFRTELMGITMCGIIIGHVMGRLSAHNIILDFIHKVLHVETFILLSGFGLFYSMRKGCKIIPFYLKRFQRVLFPFMIMVTPYLIYEYYIEKYSLLRLFLKITSLDFWFNGNYIGAWYVAFSLILYLLFPTFYKCVNREKLLYSSINSIVLIFTLIIINILIEYYFPYKYSQIEIALRHSPIFIVGMYIARFSLGNITNKAIVLYWCGVVTMILVLKLLILIGLNGSYYNDFKQLFYLPFISMLFSLMYKFDWGGGEIIMKGLRWMGNYSLEIYILHIIVYRFAVSLTGYQYFENLVGDTAAVLSTVIVSLIICVPIHNFIEKLKSKI